MAAGEKERRIFLTDQGMRSRVIQKSLPDFESMRVSNFYGMHPSVYLFDNGISKVSLQPPKSRTYNYNYNFDKTE
jgi:hypothetical protein